MSTFEKYPPENIAEAISVFKQDVEIAHEIVHGNGETEVLTESGLTPSFKKVIETFDDRLSDALANINVGLSPAGTFEDGGTIVVRTQYLQLITTVGSDLAGGYTWGGAIPEGGLVIPAGSTPSSTGGQSANAWVWRSDATVRSDLANGTADIGGQTAQSIADLRDNLANGTANVGGGKATVTLNSIKSLGSISSPKNDTSYLVTGYYEDVTVGGGSFVWEPTRPYSDHNGGTVIAPPAIAAWDGTQADIASVLNWTPTGGVGCWVRVKVNESLALEDFGFTGAEFNLIIPKILSLGAKVITASTPAVISSQTPTLSNVEIHGIDFTGTSIVRHQSNVVFYNCSFSGGVRGRPNYDSENSSYLMCEFSGSSYINCESGFNRGPRLLSVSLCNTFSSSLIFGTTLNDSVITANNVDATSRSFAISYAGSGNKITNNDVKGGVTGIIGIPTRSTNPRQDISDNVVAFNTVYDQTEESISIDTRGNSTTDGLVVTEAQITAQGATNVSINIALPAFSGIGQYMIFHTGQRAGEFYKITFRGSNGLGPYELDGYVGNAADIGQTVTVSLGCFNNQIFNNTVKNAGITGIMIWGGWINTQIDNNKVYNCPISVKTLAGITSIYTNSRQPTHKTSLTRNTVYGNIIDISSQIYNSATVINPVGLVVKDNPSKVVNTLTAQTKAVSGNDSYSGSGISVTNDNKEITVRIPKKTMTNSVVEDIWEFELPKTFSVVVDVDAQIQLFQCVGSRKSTVLGYRSNETTSLFGSSVVHEALNKLENTPSSRKIETMDITSEMVSTSVFNDSAKLKIKFSASFSGASVSPSTTYNLFAVIRMRFVEP